MNALFNSERVDLEETLRRINRKRNRRADFIVVGYTALIFLVGILIGHYLW